MWGKRTLSNQVAAALANLRTVMLHRGQSPSQVRASAAAQLRTSGKEPKDPLSPPWESIGITRLAVATATSGRREGNGRPCPSLGNWFADAFMGSMGSLQAFVDGVAQALPTRLENAIGTIRVVEAAYISSERDGISMQLPQLSG
jgi:hypothetical protein